MGKEYTPTTGQVRDYYAADEAGVPRDKYFPEFDRWLTEILAEAFERGFNAGYFNREDLDEDR